MEEQKLLNVHEMAQILGVPASWLYRRTCERRIPFYKLGKYVRMNPVEVMESLKNKEQMYGQRQCS